jgi:hypothetical protein
MDESHFWDMLHNLHERVLMLEAGHKAPLSHVDRIIAKDLDAKRKAPHEEAQRRLEAFRAGKPRRSAQATISRPTTFGAS